MRLIWIDVELRPEKSEAIDRFFVGQSEKYSLDERSSWCEPWKTTATGALIRTLLWETGSAIG
jgi:hypothetical protein